jgi:NAD(P)-dependent dehydrogenase (short-subunit alcohol dehydrogenase family)
MNRRVVLITGAAGGIGSATAEVFAEARWHVVGVDRKQVDAPPGVAHFIQADISDPRAQERIFSQLTANEGRLDAMVNNAGVQICKPLLETTPEEWDMVMSNNLRSVFLGVRHAYPLLCQHGGAIVNVSSVHAVATSRNIAAYAASKGALLALTRAMALEFGPDGVRVNAILPGAVDTRMLRAGLNRGHVEGENMEDLIRGLGREHVMGRVGRPQEIGRAILFLADNEQSSFMTGQALIVDGGATARLSTE